MSIQYMMRGFETHDLQNMGLLPKPLDQGSRPIVLGSLNNQNNYTK